MEGAATGAGLPSGSACGGGADGAFVAAGAGGAEPRIRLTAWTRSSVPFRGDHQALVGAFGASQIKQVIDLFSCEGDDRERASPGGGTDLLEELEGTVIAGPQTQKHGVQARLIDRVQPLR